MCIRDSVNVVAQYGSATNQETLTVPKPCMIIASADHGVADMGVSAYPKETTVGMTPVSYTHLVLDGEPMDIFNNHRDALQAVGVDVPPVSVTMEYLREQGLDVSNRVLSVDDAVQAILEGGSHVK